MTHFIARKNAKRLVIVFVLTAGYMVAEAVAGWMTGSLALLADAGHMLTDAGALGLSLFAAWFAGRPATQEKSYGYYRAEILAALVNAVLLLFISAYILYEAWRRFRNPPEVMGLPMLIVAIVGLGVNLIGMRLLTESSKESLNIKAAYLEVLSDLLASVGVIAAAAIMLTTKWYLADPLISAGIGLFIVPRTWALLKQAVHVLMEGTPAHLDLSAIEEAIKRVQGVKEIHDLHVWTITSGIESMSGHITIEDLSDSDRIISELQKTLKEKFNISHTTIQLEAACCEENGKPIHG